MTAYPSPNHGDRRGQVPSLIVIHYTGMADSPSARARLCDAAAEVSAHWLIDAEGTTEQLVCETRRAWHAGAGRWQGLDDVNSRSIGIELANPGDRPYPAPQMAALRRLLRDIMDRWSIGPAAVIGHSDLAPGRKDRPCPRFDWVSWRLRVWRHSPAPRRPTLTPLWRRACPPWAIPTCRRAWMRSACATVPGPRARRRPTTAAPSRGFLGTAASTPPRRVPYGRRAEGWMTAAGRPVEESPDSMRRWCRVTPGGGNPRDSATENRPPIPGW